MAIKTTKTANIEAEATTSKASTKTQKSLVDVYGERKDVQTEMGKYKGDALTVGTEANTKLNDWWNAYGSKEYANTELVSPEKIQTDEEANNFINSNQEAEVSDLPENRTTVSSVEDIAKTATQGIDKAISDSGVSQPKSYSAEESYIGLTEKYNTEDLENSINKLQTRKETLQSGLEQINEEEGSKGAAMSIISGKRSENNRKIQIELDAIDRQINTATRQLSTKYSAISMIMGFKQTDYQNATTEYNNKFSQAMSMLNYATGLANTEYTQQKAEEDTARANLQVIYNGIKESGKSIDNMDETQKTMITSLEVQAGLPIGFYKSFESVNAGGEIVTTSSFTDANNNKVVSVITRDKKTGALSTQNMVVGKEKAASSGSGSATPSSYKEWQLAGGSNSGYSYADWVKGDGGAAENKQIQALRNDAANMVQKLDKGEIEWGAAWDSLHIKYPQASNEKIDELLGGKYDAASGTSTGRAASK